MSSNNNPYYYFFISILLLLCLVIRAMSTKASSCGWDDEQLPPLSPATWPDSFHALLYMNLTDTRKLLVTDLWYDWPRRRNMNRMQRQLDTVLYDVEWNNGTSYYYTVDDSDVASCLVRHFPVGIPRRDWMMGSTYLGTSYVDGFRCHVWTKLEFIWYYEDVDTRRPVRWDFFDGISTHVITFEVGAVLEDSQWQAPAYCFSNGDNSSHGDEQATSIASEAVAASLRRLTSLDTLIAIY